MRRRRTLSRRLEDGVSIRAADMPGADELMRLVSAALAQKEQELIAGRIRAALATQARQEAADQAAHRLALEVERLRAERCASAAAFLHAASAMPLTRRLARS